MIFVNFNKKSKAKTKKSVPRNFDFGTTNDAKWKTKQKKPLYSILLGQRIFIN